ncbi:hypothetical protein ACWIUD_09690 [Helicobacter sp. 23-1044]
MICRIWRRFCEFRIFFTRFCDSQNLNIFFGLPRSLYSLAMTKNIKTAQITYPRHKLSPKDELH